MLIIEFYNKDKYENLIKIKNTYKAFDAITLSQDIF